MVQRSKGIFFTKFGQKGKSFSSDGSSQTFSFVPVDNRALLFSQGAMTRSSEASWFYTSSGEMTWWPANTVRETKEFTPEGYPYFAIEGSKLNYKSQSEELEVWSSSSAIVFPNEQIAPDGATDAEYVYYTADDGNVRATFFGALTTTGSWTISVFALTSSSEKEFRMTILQSNTTESSPRLHVTASSARWGRFSFTENSVSPGATTMQMRLYNSGSFNQGIYYWGAQAETGSFPTSYIHGATTREADNLSFSEAGSWVNEPWHFYFKPEWATGETYFDSEYLFITSAGADLVRLAGNGDTIQVWAGNVKVLDSGGILNIARNQQVRIDLNPPSGTLTVSGASSGDGTYTGTPWSWGINSSLRIGNTLGGSRPYHGLLSEPISLSRPTTTLIGESDFTASNHYTRHDDNTYLEGGTSMFRAVMFRLDQAPPYGGSVYLWSKAWTLRCTAGGVLTAQLSDGGANAVACSASAFTSDDVGKVFLATFYYDGDEMSFYINGVEKQLAISTVSGFTGNSRRIVLGGFDNGLGDIVQHGTPFTIIGAAATDTSISIGLSPMDYYLACSGAGDILPFANCQHLYSKKRSGNLGFDRITGAHLALTGTLKTQGPFVPTYG